MPFRRIFFAVPVPEEVVRFQNKLREINASSKKIKWTRDQNIHLTIYFIGNIPAGNFEKIIDLVTPVFSGREKFSLSFDSLFFAPSARPRMLWAKYHKNELFTQLSQAIHLALSGLIGQENKFYFKEPIPHITLARFHSMKNYRDINLGNFNNPQVLPEINIRSCELWETINTEGRSDYRSISSFSF